MKIEAGIFEYYRLTKEKDINPKESKKLLRHNYGCMERILTKRPTYLIDSINELSEQGEKLNYDNIYDHALGKKLEAQFSSPTYLEMNSWLMGL